MVDSEASPLEKATRESLLGSDTIPPLQDVPLHRVSRLLYLRPGVYEGTGKHRETVQPPWMGFQGLFLPPVQESASSIPEDLITLFK